jgi:hypothetical protein
LRPAGVHQWDTNYQSAYFFKDILDSETDLASPPNPNRCLFCRGVDNVFISFNLSETGHTAAFNRNPADLVKCIPLRPAHQRRSISPTGETLVFQDIRGFRCDGGRCLRSGDRLYIRQCDIHHTIRAVFERKVAPAGEWWGWVLIGAVRW